MKPTSDIELAAYEDWLDGSAVIDWRYGRCESCGEVRDEDGRPLFVSRRIRHGWECFKCWERQT